MQTMTLTTPDYFATPSTHAQIAQGSSFYQRVQSAGNITMAIAVIGMLLSILVGYTFATHFSLVAQVASHIALILFATFIKIGYVVRCIGLDGLGYKQL
ncbi:hypothetical protein FLM48_03895 [Shewanella sp. Scap07]|uniref:hypothetical protein n=1 Tax=Shewanella sp. Scap07 TaxID=2589987 RepID=UPI0015BDFCE0|nr:hypothetical protein [Shewanella sp. Scap07]QLE84306.1 hypothetical protein FLM48_03895 [Shewanella sp. Scap07]